MRRAVTLKDGVAMVVTDLHGVGSVYTHLRDTFLREYEAGRVQRWILCGDLIHTVDAAPPDDSLPMLLDVMRLQAQLGDETVILLCGNHEMPHIYGQTLARGDAVFTPWFEHALSALDAQPDTPFRRADVSAFLASLPFYVFTAAGVMLCHAGPSASITTPQAAAQILDFDHAALLADVDAKLAQYDLNHAGNLYAQRSGGEYTYAQIVETFLAVKSSKDARYNHLLRAFVLDSDPRYTLLWDALFTRNELDFPNDMRRFTLYEPIVQGFLAAFSAQLPNMPQRVVVSGHIAVQGGHMVVDDRHLRLATHAHAQPNSAGQYLLLDCAAPIADADALVPMLRNTV